METVKPFLTEDEEILWEGKPAKGAIKEEFILVFGLMLIVLILFNCGFTFLAMMSFSSNLGLGIFVICFIVGVDALLVLVLIVVSKERSFGAISYLITSKNIYVVAPSTLRKKYLRMNYFEFDIEWVHVPGDFFYLPLEKIQQIRIRANTGIREFFGLLGYDVFLSISEIFGLRGTYKFAQIYEIPELINVIMHNLGFYRSESSSSMESYVRFFSSSPEIDQKHHYYRDFYRRRANLLFWICIAFLVIFGLFIFSSGILNSAVGVPVAIIFGSIPYVLLCLISYYSRKSKKYVLKI